MSELGAMRLNVENKKQKLPPKMLILDGNQRVWFENFDFSHKISSVNKIDLTFMVSYFLKKSNSIGNVFIIINWFIYTNVLS